LDREKFAWARSYTIDNTLREKWFSRQTAEDYQQKILMGKC